MSIRALSEYDKNYQPPRGNVLLLSCMDLRLLDDITHFMNHDNLTNRYDHVVFAGAAFGALGAPEGKDEEGNDISCPHWFKAFTDHLTAAIKLHQVEDIYVLEHQNCGAYYKYFHIAPNFGDSGSEQREEYKVHRKYTQLLDKALINWAKELKERINLRTHKFIMDLRGDVKKLAPMKVISQDAKAST
jgi:hypothetical protein